MGGHTFIESRFTRPHGMQCGLRYWPQALGVGRIQTYLRTMTRYISESHLRQMLVAVMQAEASTLLDLGLEMSHGPYRPGNWRVVWFAVHTTESDLVRKLVVKINAGEDWVMVPDRNPLDGLVYISDAELDEMSAQFVGVNSDFLTAVRSMRGPLPN